MHLEQNKHMDAKLLAFRQKKIERLLEKDILKVVASNKIVMPKEVPSSTQDFNSRFVDEIKDPYIDKTYKKSCLIVYTYNEKKNLVLTYSARISRVR